MPLKKTSAEKNANRKIVVDVVKKRFFSDTLFCVVTNDAQHIQYKRIFAYKSVRKCKEGTFSSFFSLHAHPVDRLCANYMGEKKIETVHVTRRQMDARLSHKSIRMR